MTMSAIRPTPPQAPVKFFADPKLLLQTTEATIAALRHAEDSIVASASTEEACFENVMVPLMHVRNAYLDHSLLTGFLKDVSADKELRSASASADKLFKHYQVESSMRQDVFRLVKAVVDKKEPLEGERLHCLTRGYQEYICNGLDLPDERQRQHLQDIRKRMADISTECRRNFSADPSGLWLTLDELDGFPKDMLSGLKRGGDENKDKLFLTLKPMDYDPAMKFIKDPLVRKKVFLGFENRCGANVPLLRELFVLRDEAARLVGYPNNAALKLEEKMAESLEFVSSFLQDLVERLQPACREWKKLALQAKAEHLRSLGLEDMDDGKLYHWDAAHSTARILEQRLSLDQNKVAEYCTVEKTLSGMLSTFAHLLGLRFFEITADLTKHVNEGYSDLWHEDLRVFEVWNDETEGGSFLGYLYLDLHPRDFKLSHPTHITLQGGYTKEDGSRHYPVSAPVCSFTKPLANRPSTLKHRECVSFFHELGHAIHSMVSRTEFGRFHGTRTARDFAEAPSKMLENWFWAPDQLRTMSFHYAHLSPEYMAAWQAENPGAPEPPERMPDEMVAAIVHSRDFDGAYFHLTQVFLARLDLMVHAPRSHGEIERMDIQRRCNRLRDEITLVDGPDDEDYAWGHRYAKFSHLWGGYDGGYYGYVLASSISADMFQTAFAGDPMNAEEGRRYRYTVLQPGGSRPEMQTLVEFLGRKPSSEAWMRQLGLGGSAPSR